MLDKINLYESQLTDFIKKNRQKNTDIKNALLIELDHIGQNNDIKEAFEQIKDLKQRWIKTGSPDESIKEQVEKKFQDGMDAFFEKRASFMEAKKMLNSARTEDYQNIIDKVLKLTSEANFAKSQDQVKSLQKQWKEAGRIPEDEFKKLNEAYRKATKIYFDKRKGIGTRASKDY